MNRHLFRIPDCFADRVLLTEEGERDLTYRNIDALLPDSIAAAVLRRTVMCVCSQTSSCVAGFLALEQAGSVPFMVGQSIEQDEIYKLLAEYKICYIWAPTERMDELLRAGKWKELVRFRNYILAEKCLAKRESCPLHPDLALLLGTSGSTGERKFVRLSKTNVLKGVELVQMITEFSCDDVGLVYLPTEHCFTIALIHGLYAVGGKLVCAPGGIMQLASPGFIDRNGITFMISVSFIIEFLRKTDFFDSKHPSLRLITNGAGATPKETQDFLREYMKAQGGSMIPTYGQTEVTIVGSALPAKYTDRIYNSIGKPFGDIVMTIDNPDENGIGELVIRSDAVMMGYAYSSDDLNKGNSLNGVLYTGDLAVKDEEGFFYIKGRKSHFSKINGKRISLQVIEERLKEHFKGYDFACISNDRNILVITTAEGEHFGEIKEIAARTAGVQFVLTDCRHCDIIPRNETGKIQYHILEKQWIRYM